MSADPHAAHGHGEIEMPHATMRDYVIGFVLSVILTAIPFWLVMTMPLSAGTTGAIIMAFAVVQIVVHMVFFLHMTPKAEGGWSLTSLVFTVIVVVIMLAGSLWVMHHLNTNMMPMPHEPTSRIESQAP
ncbi:cytochrome o ubiquinol oxidase subunit IV [Sphingopyxis alaskensis]|uniref:cytochrome o ubiquinol oxidase subunit IV n=1 Tax=Sphingopyxis alaskensis TaxID=117207 RepID=UPI00391CB9FD